MMRIQSITKIGCFRDMASICFLTWMMNTLAFIVQLLFKLCITIRSIFVLQPNGLQPARFLCPWDFPGRNTGVDCHFLPQGIYLTQGQNPHLLHCRRILYHLSYQGSPIQSIKKFYTGPRQKGISLRSHNARFRTSFCLNHMIPFFQIFFSHSFQYIIQKQSLLK